MSKFIIAPSILSANFAYLGAEVVDVLNAGADWVHVDVMDNHYVPNLTFGPMICQALRDFGIQATFDVHLMVDPVDDLITQFAKAGANWISIHPEATLHLDRSLRLIQDLGCHAGLVLNPATPLSHLDYCLEQLDLILIMSVNPGFGGQRFIPAMLAKIQKVRERIDASQRDIRLSVDGGINPENIKSIASAGADTFVAGSAIFSYDDYAQRLKIFRQALESLGTCMK